MRFGYWLTVDRHGLRPRDDKGELRDSTVRLLRASGSPLAYSPRDDKMVGKRNGQSLLFTLHPSIFTLPSLAFLETYTEAYVVIAETGGGVEALS